ncbi:hypothetical protein [Acinetobacter baumannii]|uniref:hypothetical protein n=1 Tax=Acinetobacter baumannii TaxID=470 RepID=UPI003B841294
MGLKVHSLQNVPKTENRDFFIYLLDYGWHEPLSRTLRENFDLMAKKAAVSRAVVIQGTEIGHFENEVFSWHGMALLHKGLKDRAPPKRSKFKLQFGFEVGLIP